MSSFSLFVGALEVSGTAPPVETQAKLVTARVSRGEGRALVVSAGGVVSLGRVGASGGREVLCAGRAGLWGRVSRSADFRFRASPAVCMRSIVRLIGALCLCMRVRSVVAVSWGVDVDEEGVGTAGTV